MTTVDRYDALLLDLDGTVYRGRQLIEGAAEVVAAAADAGTQVRFVTNNAARTPEAVTETLRSLGITAAPDEVNTSAQAAASVAAELGARTALVVGSAALEGELDGCGLRVVRDNSEAVPDVVVQGLSKDVGWPQLAEACLAIGAGARWVATNTDPTLPTERGLMPGNGSLVAAVRTATGVEPTVAGKPQAPLMRMAVRSAGSTQPLVVGDRLDTDIAAATAIGADAMVVLSGACLPADVLWAPESQRPRYIAADLTGVFGQPGVLEVGERQAWQVRCSDDALSATGDGEPLDLLRALCAVAWRMDEPPKTVTAEDEAASAAMRSLRIDEATAGRP